jgi:hypothetical protein
VEKRTASVSESFNLISLVLDCFVMGYVSVSVITNRDVTEYCSFVSLCQRNVTYFAKTVCYILI